MDKERLVIMKAEIDAQVREIENIYAKLQERKRKRGKAGIESVGYQLHNLYCAFEDLFKMVTNSFENQIQDKGRYHLDLLRRMTVPIEGVRPPFISQKGYILLDNLRAFRHLFRHAYSYELDERKVKLVFEDAIRLKGIYVKDIHEFLDILQGR